MPQASDELRDQMRQRFGSLDTSGPEKYLTDRGYKITRAWEWEKPGVHDMRQMTRDEFDCLKFLCLEWDYGGLAIALDAPVTPDQSGAQ